MQAPSPRPMIIHAGFHKTGTTTVQNVLKSQYPFLSPHVCVILKSDVSQLCQTAQAYATKPGKARLSAFREAAAACFGDMSDDDARPILLSAEDLCGAIPGRSGRIGYPHATTLLTTLISQITPDCAPQIYLSTRAALPWLKSCYAHNLRHGRTRLSRDDFIAAHAGPSLRDIADDIASALDGVPLTTAALEDTSASAQGPLTPILDLLNLATELREPLRPTSVANPSLPPDIQTAFLLLNREENDGARRSAAKNSWLPIT